MMVIERINNEQQWFDLRYEHLPNYCYWCGGFDHVEWKCVVAFEDEAKVGDERRFVGLKATNTRAPFSKVANGGKWGSDGGIGGAAPRFVHQHTESQMVIGSVGDGGSAVLDFVAGASTAVEPPLAKALTNMRLGDSLAAGAQASGKGICGAADVEVGEALCAGAEQLALANGALLGGMEVRILGDSTGIATGVLGSRVCIVEGEIDEGEGQEVDVLTAGHETGGTVLGQGRETGLIQEVGSLAVIGSGLTEVAVSGQKMGRDGCAREVEGKAGVQVDGRSREADKVGGIGKVSMSGHF